MSTRHRRLQILLDDERYHRLEREAQQSGRSIAAIVREAIDLRFSTVPAARVEAGHRVMAEFSDRVGHEPDWSETKAILERDLDAKLQ